MRLFFIFTFFCQLLFCQNSSSPSGDIMVNFSISSLGEPHYEVLFKNKIIIEKSKLGFQLKENFDLNQDFTIENIKYNTINEDWQPVLGEESNIKNNYNEMIVMLKQNKSKIKINIHFKIYNEGVGFRYEFPKQELLNYFVIQEEQTQFQFNQDYKCFWIPGDYDSQEYAYNTTLFSEIDVEKVNLNNGIGMKGPLGKYRIQSPVQLKSSSGVYVNVFEAAVQNYPIMHLDVIPQKYLFTSHLVPNAIGDKAYLQTPCYTPWRTIMITDDARQIVASKMILNLNEPTKFDDTSWIKPMKYVGIWWEMHVGKATWDYAGSQNAQNNSSELKPTGKHGATTQNTKKYIDFAAKHGFDGVLIEGWNVGWEDWFGNWKEDVFDFITPYPDFNLEEVSNYAKAKGVQLIMHHETSGSVANYERYLDRAFNLMKKYNYPAVKTGYVGKIIPRGEWHDGQTMVNHYHYVVKRAADNKIMVNSHESSRPTGIHRTYPNYIAAEAARGNEFNAWSIGNPPSHETILPFTRLLGGPMDYTPGIFEIKMSHYDISKKEQIHTTLAKQLALYVTLYSPLQMAADLPENYEKYVDAFQFIKDVAVDWQATKVLEAEPGEFITIARKEKQGERWFLGAITNEEKRNTTIELNFLNSKKKYNAVIYEDADDAHWQTNPKAYKIKTITVTSKSKLKLKLANGGGCAISFTPIN